MAEIGPGIGLGEAVAIPVIRPGASSPSEYPAYARRAYVEIVYDGKTTQLSDCLESLNYTDNASGALDDIALVLDSKYSLGWTPEKEKDLDVTIVMENWYVNGVTERYHCGNFVVDDITLDGSPRIMTVKAISQPASSDFKEVPVTKTWQNVTLRQIVEGIMAKHGMTVLIYNADEVPIETIEQSDKSDSEFITELCKKYGLSCKTYKVGFVIFDEARYEANQSYNKFGDYPADWATMTEDWTVHEIQPGWKWNTTLQGTYTGAEISYTNGKKGETVKATVGEPTRLLRLREKADSIAEAEKIAKDRVNEENKKAVTFSFSPALFDPRLFASCNVDIMNLDPRVDGKYYVDKVSVSLSDGLTMDVDCHKIFPRI